MTHVPAPEHVEQIANAIAAGSKIEAIKLYRSFTGCDLKDSKDFIEKLTVELQQKDPARFPSQLTGKGCLVLLVAVMMTSIVFFLT